MKYLMLGTAIGLVLAAQGSGAFAQTAAESGGHVTPTSGGGLEEVVVTAQRREQIAQDVGIALSVVSGDQLAKEGVTKVNDLQNVVPNLEVEPAFGSGQPQFRIRGVGFQDYASNNSPTVGVYVNEVAYPIPVMTQGLIFDIQRVEVLRGPQGTLYGRNTTGGAINFITGQPTADFHAGMSAEYGRFNQFVSEGFVSGPLSDTVRARLAYGVDEGGAYQHNRDTGESLGDQNRVGGRFILEWLPSSAFDAKLELHGGRDNSQAVGLYLFEPFNTAVPFVNPDGPIIPADTDHYATGWGLNPAFAKEIGVDPNAKPGRHNTTWGSNINASYDLGQVKVSSITSYDQMNRRELGDWDATSFEDSDTFWQGNEHVWSEEFRLASSGDTRLNWVAGAYYANQNQTEVYQSDFTQVYGISGNVHYSQHVESIAGFGQADFKVTDQIDLIGGLRYEHENRDLNNFTSAFGPPGGTVTVLPPTSEHESMSPLTGKIEAQFKPVDHVMLYASASKGVKSGGFTAYNQGQESGIAPFKPETLYAYEVGFKTNLTHQIQLNGDVFYYDYHNEQVLSVVCTANGPVGKFANAPKSQIHGAELEAIWQPVHGLSISQSASYKNGKFREFEDTDIVACEEGLGTQFINRAGEHIKFPAWSYEGSIAYDWDIGDYRATLEGDYSYHDTYPSWLGPIYTLPSYWIANATLNIGPQKGPWTIGGYVRNIFNENYDLTRNFFIPQASIAQPGMPRTYGVRVSLSY